MLADQAFFGLLAFNRLWRWHLTGANNSSVSPRPADYLSACPFAIGAYLAIFARRRQQSFPTLNSTSRWAAGGFIFQTWRDQRDPWRE